MATTNRVVFAAVCALSLVMLFSPADDVPSGIEVSDKLVHFCLFAVLAVSGRLAGLPVRALAIGLLAYAGLSEVLQSVLPINRHGDVRDALADAAGVLVALGLAALLRRTVRSPDPLRGGPRTTDDGSST